MNKAYTSINSVVSVRDSLFDVGKVFALLSSDLLEVLLVLFNSHGGCASWLGALSGSWGWLSFADRFLALGGLTRCDEGGNSGCLTLDSGFLGRLLGASLNGNLGITTSLLGLSASELDSLGITFFEGPISAGVGKDSLTNSSLAASDGWHARWLCCSSSNDLCMAESLDGGLEFVISVKVGWVAGWVEVFNLELWLEAVDDESALKSSVGGEYISGVDLAEFEGPVCDNNNLGLKILDGNLWEFGVVLSEGSLGEVGWHVEERVGDKEVWSGFLDEDLEILLSEVIGEGVVVATRLDHLSVKSLEC